MFNVIGNTFQNIAGPGPGKKAKNERPDYTTINETQEAYMAYLEKALQDAGGNVLLMLFWYQAYTASQLELQLSNLQDETEKRYHELRLINRLNQRVQQHAQDTAFHTKNSDNLEGTPWESIEYILNHDHNPEYLNGQKILKEKKDLQHPDFINWKTANPSAAKYLAELYELVRKKKNPTGDESASSGYFWDFLSSYVYSSQTGNNQQKIKLEDLTEEVDALLLESFSVSLTDALKIKEFSKEYGFTEDQYKKTFKDPTGRFAGATNMLTTVAKSKDTEVQKFATRIHNTTSDLHTHTEILVNVMKSVFDSLRNFARNT